MSTLRSTENAIHLRRTLRLLRGAPFIPFYNCGLLHLNTRCYSTSCMCFFGDVYMLFWFPMLRLIRTGINMALENLLNPLYCFMGRQRRSVLAGADICERQMASHWVTPFILRRHLQFNSSFRILGRNMRHHLSGKLESFELGKLC